MEDKHYDKIADRNQLRKANHVFYEQVAETLNDAGIYQDAVIDGLRQNGKIRNTKESVKDLYRSIATQKFGVASTQDLTTIQAKEVEEDFTQAIQECFGITLPEFPSLESQYYNQLGYKKKLDK